MRLFKSISIESQLHLLVAVAGGIALLVATAAFVANDVRMMRKAHVSGLQALAEIISDDAASALVRQDMTQAKNVFAGLRLRPGIELAALYDHAGNVMALYRPPVAPPSSPPLPLPKGYYFRQGGMLEVFEPVMSGPERLGTVYVRATTNDLWGSRVEYIRIVGMVMLAAVAATQLTATRIGRIISTPITRLADTARRISNERDYSLRVGKFGKDEIGTLYDAFNDMLDQIQEREKRLQEAHEQLEGRVIERTRQLSQANEDLSREITERERAEAELEVLHRQLLDAARRAGMAEIATDVLHNVGNVLNSVNVSATLVADQIRASKVADLARAVKLLDEHKRDLARYLDEDQRGRKLPEFLALISKRLEQERVALAHEIATLTKNIDHIKTIVAMQQSYAGVSGIIETVSLPELIDDVLKLNACSIEAHGIKVFCDYDDVPPVGVEKLKLLQVLVNLINNARDALVASDREDRQLTVRLRCTEDDCVEIEVADNGVGIEPENLTRIFSHGFTTKKDGHGFGLHSCALAAREMRGSLAAHSEGINQGASFVLDLPLTPIEVGV